MAQTHISQRFSLSLVLLLTASGLFLTAPAAHANLSKQVQDRAELLVDFDDEDGLTNAEEGVNAIYVDTEGNVLGTFVNIPGAKIKVYADGRIELEDRDYTTELDYYSNGRIRSIGDDRFRYANSGRIRSIGTTDFRYTRSGVFRRVGNTELDYSARGRLQKIENVDFDYDRDGTIETIEDRETQDGIRIIVVN